MKHIQAIFKKILVLTLSVCLLNLSVQMSTGGFSFSMQSVMAEEATDNTTEEETKKLTKTLDVTVKDRSGKFGAGAMSIIMMMATGYLAARLFMMCSTMPMDTMLAASAGVIYILGEILAYSDFNKMKDKTMEIAIAEDGEIDNVQIETLKAQKQLYMDVIATAETKKMLQSAAASAFGLAGVFVGYTAYQESALGALCSVCPASAVTVVAREAKDVVPASSTAQGASRLAMCKAAVGAASAATATVVGATVCAAPLANCSVLLGSCMTSTAMCSPVVVASKPDSNFIKYAASAIDLNLPSSNMSYEVSYEKIENQPLESLGKLFANIANIFIPQANASLEALGFVGATTVIVWGLVSSLWVSLDTFIASPFNRLILYSTMGTMALGAINQTKSVIKRSEENVKKIDNILTLANNLAKLQEINASTSTDLGLQVLAVGDLGFKIPTEDIILTETTPCAKPGSKPGACGSVQAAIEGDGNFGLLGSNFAAYASTTGAIADGFSGTNVLSTTIMNTTGDLANGGAAINKMLEKQKRKLNEQRKKQGKAEINFDKLENDLLSSMGRKTAKALKNNGSNPSSLLASIGQSGKGVTESKVSKHKPKLKKSIKRKVRAGGYKLKKGGFNLDLDNDQITSDEMSANVDQLASADDLNEDHGDIVNNPNADIFKVISVRYMKSGYSKLLEEK